jgi:PAS domain-containing protein
MAQGIFSDSGFFSHIFNAIPSALFVVDDDVRIMYMNHAAAEAFCKDGQVPSMKRGGDALHCLQAAGTPEGCGRADACGECVLRNSVHEAFLGGKVYRKKTVMTIAANGGQRDVHVLVTTSPFQFQGKAYALLILEDISELLQLRSLLPICAWCKKIRDDENYWQSLEQYFGTHHDLSFSHGICDECYRKHSAEFSGREDR